MRDDDGAGDVAAVVDADAAAAVVDVADVATEAVADDVVAAAGGVYVADVNVAVVENAIVAAVADAFLHVYQPY